MNDLPNDIKFLVFDYLHSSDIREITKHTDVDIFHNYSINYCTLFITRDKTNLFKLGNGRKIRTLTISIVLTKFVRDYNLDELSDRKNSVEFSNEMISVFNNITALAIGCDIPDRINDVKIPIHEFKNLRMLKCCHSEMISPSFTKLTVLDCSKSTIQQIPSELINLTELNCSDGWITEIPNTLINLTELNCGSCHRIQKMPKELVNLTRLNCDFCEQLLEIPHELVNLTLLECCICDRIKEIPKELVKLTYLECSNCSSLQKIPKELINLKYLYCMSCINLTELKLPNLELVNYSGCNNRTINEKIPQHVRHTYCGGLLRCEICLSYMNKSPVASSCKKLNDLSLIENIFDVFNNLR